MLQAYQKRRMREMREHGVLMNLAFNEPDKITEVFADPVVAAPTNELVETERWW
jgi:hypothetical protein